MREKTSSSKFKLKKLKCWEKSSQISSSNTLNVSEEILLSNFPRLDQSSKLRSLTVLVLRVT